MSLYFHVMFIFTFHTHTVIKNKLGFKVSNGFVTSTLGHLLPFPFYFSYNESANETGSFKCPQNKHATCKTVKILHILEMRRVREVFWVIAGHFVQRTDSPLPDILVISRTL